MQLVLVIEIDDVQSFEALLRVDGAPEDGKHRIDRFGGGSLQVLNGDKVCGLSLVIADQAYEIGKLTEASAYCVLVEFDEAALNVYGPIWDDIGLERHGEEGRVIDRKQELVSGHVVVDLNLPLEFLVPQSEREHPRSGEFLATENTQNIRIRGGLRR